MPIIIGAAIGAYSGWQIGEAAGAEGWEMAGYIAGGAVIGGVSGGVAAEVGAASIAGAKTLAIATGSTMNSLGMHALSGGQTDVSTSFGAFSVNWSSGDVGYLGKKGNTGLENFGYALGALANVSDVMAGLPKNQGDVTLVTENSDAIGHSAIVDDQGNTLISVGPDQAGAYSVKELAGGVGGTNKWNSYNSPQYNNVTNKIVLKNVNLNRIVKYANRLNRLEQAGTFRYNLLTSSCVNHTARALNLSGALNFGSLHPFILNAQMSFRSDQLYLTSYYLQQQY